MLTIHLLLFPCSHVRRGHDAVVAGIEARIAEWTRLPPDHGEPIQVLRYQNGQKYDGECVGAMMVMQLLLLVAGRAAVGRA